MKAYTVIAKAFLGVCGLLLVFSSPAFAADSDDIWCRLSIKRSKSSPAEIDRAPCQSRVIKGTKFFSEEYDINGTKVRVDRLEEAQGAEPFKAKVNGKIGTMQEENRYSFNFISDDLTLEFGYDSVLPDSKHTLSSIQGVWHKNPKSGCHSDDPGTITIKGSTVVKNGGETSCKIYQIGALTSTDTKTALMRCQYEETAGKEAWNFQRTNKNEAMLNAFETYRMCKTR